MLHINQTQVTQQADQEEIINLRRVFADKKYAKLLSSLLNTKTSLATNAWNWVPVWEEAVQRGGANHVKYVFVPLEPRHAASPSEIAVFGYRRYLRFRYYDGQWDGSVLSYYNSQEKAKERTRIEKAGSVSFFKKFTGNVVETHIESGKSTFYAYANGLKQKKSIPLSSGATGACLAGSCDWQVCEWGMSCPDGCYPMAIGVAHMEGEGGCETPVGITLECGYLTIYHLNRSYTINTCSGDEGDGGGIDPGEDGGTGTPVPRIPCKELNLINQQPAFNLSDLTLQSKLTQPIEHGYSFNDSNNAGSYLHSEATIEEPHFIRMQHTGPQAGEMNIHISGGLPIFSGSDLEYIYLLYTGKDIPNLIGYTSVLITHNGVDYALRIHDVKAFETWGKAWLSSVDNVISLEQIFYSVPFNGINENTSIADAEVRFLTMIQGSGITLLKRDRSAPSPSWHPTGFLNGSVATFPCI